MIEKMNFISITGPKDDIDRMTNLYLSQYEIQLESALSDLKTSDNLRPFVETNPYRETLNKAIIFADLLEDAGKITPDESLGLDEMFELIRHTNEKYTDYQSQKNRYKQEIETIRYKQQNIAPFRSLDCNLREIHDYRFIQYKFGRIPVEHYQRLEKYLLDELGAIFVVTLRDDSFAYGAYFVPPGESQKADTVFRSLHFEKMDIIDEFNGTPADEYQQMAAEIQEINKKVEELDKQTQEELSSHAARIIGTRNRLEELANNFDVRKLAARVDDKKDDYYILCGWMAEKDVKKFLHAVRDDDKVFVVVENDHSSYFGSPPTKLNNPRVFKPFEMFIQMYGMPAHNEMDPTIWIGLSYPLIFGVMFGDVGQGLLLVIGGSLLYHFKKIALAGIVAIAGIFSVIFGFMFGSFFGFDDIIQPIWMRPIENMTQLPFFGKLNTVFIVAVMFGMGVILISMIVHIINSIRSHDTEGTWFDANGIAGLIFYSSAVACLVLFMTGHKVPGGIVLGVMFGLPLIVIFFKDPITKKIQKKAELLDEGAGMFLVQSFFEMFETLLSYFSNTLSFVRIGAFAISHAAMMQVVLMLAGVEKGSTNWVIIILGNLFVCAMEGLVVGIQVLRLEFYEMFSRFYRGTGRRFTPYSKKRTN